MKTSKSSSSKGRKLGPVAQDIIDGFKAVQAEREGKITLRRTVVELPEPVALTPEAIVSIREAFNMSRAVFARKLHIPVRTLERWEHGRSSPTGPGAMLILLAAKYPDTITRLENVTP